jgi:pheromone shutdown protein TraB
MSEGEKESDVVYLRTRSGGRAILVGTGHLTGNSAAAVADIVKRECPNTLVLELDAQRFRGMGLNALLPASCRVEVSHPSPYPNGGSLSSPGLLGKTLQNYYSFQMHVLGRMLPNLAKAHKSGAEFHAACAAAQPGTRVLLGDRDQNITLRRLEAQDPYFILLASSGVLGVGYVLHPAFTPPPQVLLSQVVAAYRNDWNGFADGLKALSELSKRAHPGRDWCPAGDDFNRRLESCLRKGGRALTERESADLQNSFIRAYAGMNPSVCAAAAPAALGAERDFLLAAAMYGAPGRVVVGVIGRAHLPGVVKNWKDFQRSQPGVGVAAAALEEGEGVGGGGEEEEEEEEGEEEDGEEEWEEEGEEEGEDGKGGGHKEKGAQLGPLRHSSSASSFFTPQQRRYYQDKLTIPQGSVRNLALADIALPIAITYGLVRAWRGSFLARGTLLLAVGSIIGSAHVGVTAINALAARVDTRQWQREWKRAKGPPTA